MIFVPRRFPACSLLKGNSALQSACACAPECPSSGSETRPVPIISSSRFPEYSGALNVTYCIARGLHQCHATGTAAMWAPT